MIGAFHRYSLEFIILDHNRKLGGNENSIGQRDSQNFLIW